MVDNSREAIQVRNLDALVRNGGFTFTDTFKPYTSGEIGPYYVQSVAIENSGEDYSQAIKDMANMVFDEVEFTDDDTVISGGETLDWDFSNPVAIALQLPHAKIYNNGKLLGAKMKDKQVVHVADLNNEGSSTKDKWMPYIENAGGVPGHIFFYVDRLEGVCK